MSKTKDVKHPWFNVAFNLNHPQVIEVRIEKIYLHDIGWQKQLKYEEMIRSKKKKMNCTGFGKLVAVCSLMVQTWFPRFDPRGLEIGYTNARTRIGIWIWICVCCDSMRSTRVCYCIFIIFLYTKSSKLYIQIQNTLKKKWTDPDFHKFIMLLFN